MCTTPFSSATRTTHRIPPSIACASIALLPLFAALAGAGHAADADDIDALKRQLEAATAELRKLRESLAEQERQLALDRAELTRQRAELRRIESQMTAQPGPAPLSEPLAASQLAQRARGTGAETVAQSSAADSVPSVEAQQPQVPGAAEPAPPAPTPPAKAPAPVAPAATPPQTVGQAPQKPAETAPPAVAPIFEAPGVLTPKGKWVIEPSLEYSYSSSNRVSVIGFEIFPALLVGVLDIRTANRTSYVASLTTRYGVTSRLELEAKVPYVYRDETLQSREFLQASFFDNTFHSTGSDLGDVELAARYQFNTGGMEKPYYVGTLRVKTRTGTDQFEVDREPGLPRGSGRFLQLPTGTGFYGVRPEITVIYPTDPVVFFGSLNYLWNIKRDNITDRTGQSFSSIDPGDAVGFNFGMGLALNERASFSIGYEHTVYGKSKVNGSTPPNELITQIGSLQMGYAYRLTSTTNLNLTLGIGATKDAPDVQINLRLPIMF
jgi:hypothetical protein